MNFKRLSPCIVLLSILIVISTPIVLSAEPFCGTGLPFCSQRRKLLNSEDQPGYSPRVVNPVCDTSKGYLLYCCQELALIAIGGGGTQPRYSSNYRVKNCGYKGGV